MKLCSSDNHYTTAPLRGIHEIRTQLSGRGVLTEVQLIYGCPQADVTLLFTHILEDKTSTLEGLWGHIRDTWEFGLMIE